MTNRQFKDFVDRGGYSNLQFWRHTVVDGGKERVAAETIATFRDATGRPGPATWSDGTYPIGKGDYPVTGVSWFEAAAYAESVGKRLPSIHHWSQAAASPSAEMLARLSNFEQEGVSPVGTHQGISAAGAYDMAGNAKEWCYIEARSGSRYILGGGWAEPIYMFLIHREALSPFDRGETNGFRCASNPSDGATDALTDDPVIERARDYAHEHPVSDEVFQIYKRLYAFDRTELEPRSEEPLVTTPAWRRERISLKTAYGPGRMSVQVFLPADHPPPYQTVICFPGAAVLHNTVGGNFIPFIPRSGRAFVLPRYQATLERSDGRSLNDHLSRINEFKGLVTEWSKDLARTIDYLETRSDIQHDKLAYFGNSLGGALGFNLPVLESRLKTSILVSAGVWTAEVAPEIAQVNYAPWVTLPTLMLNGRFDFVFPEPGQRQLFRLLGTPPEHKRLVLLDAGHIIRADLVEKEILDWLDVYLGPTK